jgi:hypothetical protein
MLYQAKIHINHYIKRFSKAKKRLVDTFLSILCILSF